MGRSVSQHQSAAGFSLVELVIIMGIVAVLAAIAVPRYTSSLHHYRADAAARHIAAELTRARAFARQASEAHRVQFDLNNHMVLLPDQPVSPQTNAVPRVHLARAPYHAELLKVALDDSSTTVRFDGHGKPDAGGEITLRSGATTRTLQLHPLTGETRLAQP